jgi:hypothetical protein
MEGSLPVEKRWPDLATPAIVYAVAVLPGFVTLALLGSLGSYPSGLKGFWDYSSGTVGDALLVPLLVAALTLQAGQLAGFKARNELAVGAVAASCGLLAGAAVPISWVLGGDTKPFWMLPRPHHYDLAGWVHAAYLSGIAAVISVLAVMCVRRVRVATHHGVVPTVNALMLAVGAGVAMMLLVGRDSIEGGPTVASNLTLIAISVAVAAVAGGLVWALGVPGLRTQWRAVALIAGFSAGLVGLTVPWPPRVPVLLAVSLAVVGMAAIVATRPLNHAPTTRAYRSAATVTVTALIAGGLVRAADAVDLNQHRPAIWLLAGTVLAGLVLGLVGPKGGSQRRRVLGYTLFLGYTAFICYLAMRLTVPPISSGTAGATVFVADAAFDVLVISLVQTRFGDLGRSEVDDMHDDYLTREDHEAEPDEHLRPPSTRSGPITPPDEVTPDAMLLGLAVSIALLTLLTVAAKPLGLNTGTNAPAGSRIMVAVAAGCLVFLSGGAWVALRRAGRTRKPLQIDARFSRLHSPRWAWAPPVAGAFIWLVGMATMCEGPVREPLVAALAAVLVFVLYTNALVRDTTTLQTLQPSAMNVLVACSAGVAVAFATFWLIAFGIGNGGSNVSFGWFAALTFGVFVGNILVYGLAGFSLAWGLPDRGFPQQRQLARQSVMGYLMLDGSVFGVVVSVGVVLPVYAAMRASDLHVPPLTIVASLVFLPGFVGAVIRGLRNWQRLEQVLEPARAEFGIPRVILRRADGSWPAADEIDGRRRAALAKHLHLQIFGVGALMAVGLLALAADLLA